MTTNIRNIAIIAHVEHGKPTIMTIEPEKNMKKLIIYVQKFQDKITPRLLK